MTDAPMETIAKNGAQERPGLISVGLITSNMSVKNCSAFYTMGKIPAIQHAGMDSACG